MFRKWWVWLLIVLGAAYFGNAIRAQLAKIPFLAGFFGGQVNPKVKPPTGGDSLSQ